MRQFFVYLDVCTLCRPFDDQSFLRIRLETDAVNLVMSKIHEGLLRLAVSPVHFVEISSIIRQYGTDRIAQCCRALRNIAGN